MSPEQIKSKLPPPLQGPRIEADTPHVRIELNCVCGRVLEAATYTDRGLIKMVVAPCPCYMGKK
jgi:hypothetical protein